MLYLPFLPDSLAGWDPIQFALGLERFNLAAHAPHPPGYLGHLLLGHGIEALGADPARAVLLASLAASAAGVGAVFLLGARLYGRSAGLAAAALFATHPLVWSQAVSGESYPAEALFGTLLVLAGLGVGPGASRLRLWAFLAFYGLSGGIRQGLSLFFLPFAAWRLWRARGDRPGETILRVLGAGVAGALGVLAWVTPLALLSGGLSEMVAAADRQLFQVFGRAYSPLMGASRAATMGNLDGLWRFVVVALSVCGLVGLVLWPLVRRRGESDPDPGPSGLPAVPARERHWAFLLWVIPPFLWFVLMFAYKAAYLLLLVPMVAVVAGAVMVRAGRVAAAPRVAAGGVPDAQNGSVARWTAALVTAVCLGQAVLFLSPPAAWTRTFGDTGFPTALYADAETGALVRAIEGLAGGDPDGVLVVTRDARFTFRRAMWHLPDLRVLWLMDVDSTGVPMKGVEVCTARSHGVSFASGAEGFWRWDELPARAEVRLAPSTRAIAWFADPAGPFAAALRNGVPLRAVQAERPFELLVTDLPAGPVRLEVGPYVFLRDGP